MFDPVPPYPPRLQRARIGSGGLIQRMMI
jgi:hypothetical protein